MKYQVFISHSVKDLPWAERIQAMANEAGVDAYLFEHDKRPGEQISDKIQSAIDDSDALIVLLTENSKHSPYVQQEIGYAEANIPVIPIVEEGMGEVSLAMLEGREYVEFNPEAPHESINDLFSYLDELRTEKRRNRNLGLLIIGGFLAWAFLAKDDNGGDIS